MTLLKVTAPKNAGRYTLTDRFTGELLYESDLLQCGHCQHTWRYRVGSGILRGFCRVCMRHRCMRPGCPEKCYTFEQRTQDLEDIERRNRGSIEAAVRQQELREHIYSNRAGIRNPNAPRR